MTFGTLPMNASQMQIVLEWWNVENSVSHMIRQTIYIYIYKAVHEQKYLYMKFYELDLPPMFQTHQNHIYELDVMLMVS